jgi:hypothetical protein
VLVCAAQVRLDLRAAGEVEVRVARRLAERRVQVLVRERGAGRARVELPVERLDQLITQPPSTFTDWPVT